MKLKSLTFILLTLLMLPQIAAQSQEGQVTVPDLTGLNIPQAAAALNRNQLALGEELVELYSASSTVPQDTIAQQSIAPGSVASPGTAVDVTVLRTPNVMLVYDDNDLTLVNRDRKRIEFADIEFMTNISVTNANFAASRWGNRVPGGSCAQVWSVGRTSPKDVDGCENIERWLTTNNPAEHFWTEANGVTDFVIVEDGIQRGTCPAAPVNSESRPTQCEFYLTPAGQADSVDFIYFAYTPEQFLIFNQTDDQWMRLNRSLIHHRNPNASLFSTSFEPGRPALFGDPDIVARIQRLAPGQCLLFKIESVEGELPESCDVIAELQVPTTQAFWIFDFELQSASDDRRRLCKAAAADKLTICILPR